MYVRILVKTSIEKRAKESKKDVNIEKLSPSKTEEG